MVIEYVSSLKAAWELAKGLKQATDAIDDANLKMQMAELISALANAKIEAAESADKLAELERVIATRSAMKFNGSIYYSEGDNGESDGPFCPTCFDSTDKAIRLKHNKGAMLGDWYCNVCKSQFR